jgi:hypothetical protein
MEANGVKIQDSLPLFQMNFEYYFWNFQFLWYFFTSLSAKSQKLENLK